MIEMIAHASKQQKTSESDTSLPIYGECIEVFTSDEFLEQIDKTDSRSTLVLHVYDPSIRVCIHFISFSYLYFILFRLVLHLINIFK